jgi:hypothetical protein
MKLPDRVRAVLRVFGVGRVLLYTRYAWRLVSDADFWRVQSDSWRDYWGWYVRNRPILRPPLYPAGSRKRALIVTKGTLNGAQIELALIKGLELGGFVPTVLTSRPDLRKHYRLAGVQSFVMWREFPERPPVEVADALVAQAHVIEDLIDFEHLGTRVGKFALSTTFRSLRVGRLDMTEARTRQRLAKHVAQGMARASAAARILDQVKPDVVLLMGNRYTGHGEMMDLCLSRGIDVLTWFDSHRSSSLMFKRYHPANRDLHHASLSDDSWERLRRLPWTAERRAALKRELRDPYEAGDWYSRGGTQVNKSIFAADAVRARLGLDPEKKTAVIFPHVVWDATLFWGTDLFSNYQDWLIATVRAACANPNLNWLIKIHPVHVQKRAVEGYLEDASETAVIHKYVGELPPHVHIIPPDTDINTYSLFPLMDYCLTVRGTIGIEAACLGIPVLTAGTGRYDHRGFTVDSDSREEYLARLATLETMAPMKSGDRELAERFAYGAFVLRPLPLTAVTIEHGRDRKATQQVRVNAADSRALAHSPDLVALGAWAVDRDREDFLWDPRGELDLPAVERQAS